MEQNGDKCDSPAMNQAVLLHASTHLALLATLIGSIVVSLFAKAQRTRHLSRVAWLVSGSARIRDQHGVS